VQWLELQTPECQNLGSNLCCGVQPWASSLASVAPIHPAFNMYVQ